ncbi:MAG: anti-sigma factor [Siphonobacter aquaeclarae]|nr:anti-sigma factor [Siphonobacter aquaeclarae]
MNEQEIVSSGLLESYVLGFTSEEENSQVEKWLKQNAEFREHVEDVRSTLEDYAWEVAQEPPAHLRNQILGSLQTLSEAGKTAVNGASHRPSAEPAPGLSILRSISGSRNWAAAAAVIVVLSVVGNILLFRQWKKTEDLVSSLESQNTQLANNLNVQKASFISIREEIAVLQNPGTKLIKLKGEPIAPTAFAMLYWNDDKSETYLANVQLPSAPNGKQYQLWAIVDGKPVDAGVFDPVTSMQKVKQVEGASSYAISLEPKGGSRESGPTGQVYVKGGI